MSQPEDAWEALRQSYAAAMSAEITTWWNGIALPSIESELSFDEVIIHGGLGERGGFRADFLMASLNEGVISDLDLVCSYPHTKATRQLANTTAAAKLLLTAVTPGEWGNAIRITITNPGSPNAALTVTARGREVAISLATDAGSAVTTTPQLVKTAIEASAATLELVTPTLIGLSAGVMAAGDTTLTGGGGRTARILDRKVTNRGLVSITCGEPRNK